VAGTGAPGTGSVLRADARFRRLPRPEYDIDARGIRPQTAATLAVLGAVLLSAAPFGAWLRVTRRAAATAEVEVVQEVLGRSLGGGGLLVALGLASFPVAALWLRSSRWSTRVAHGVVGAATVTVVALLLQLQGRIGAAASDAVEQAGFYDLTPGAGWGAWAGLVGAAVLLLSALYAALADHTEAHP
jgi:hypothetical protein